MAPQAKILVDFHSFFNRKHDFLVRKRQIFRLRRARMLYCGSSKILINPLFLIKIGAEGAENFWGVWSIPLPFYPPLRIPFLVIRGGKTVTVSSDWLEVPEKVPVFVPLKKTVAI